MPQSIFISHTHTDEPIADAIDAASKTLYGEGVVVNYSTKKELSGGIKPGEDWYHWIGQQVREAKASLILLTPGSIQKPWLLWEAGAVAGAIGATEGGERKLCPISYGLSSSDVPSPFGRTQMTDGLKKGDIARLFEDLAALFELPRDKLVNLGRRLDDACQTYLDRTATGLRTSPLLVTEAAVQEWLERINDLRKEGRFSETDELHDWLNVAFGREGGENERPLDVRIHRQLGELYAGAGKGKERRAARQFELARRLAPRDIYVLRRLGKAYLDLDDSEAAGKIIDTIGELDPEAFARNAENAALKARWYSDRGMFADAAEVLKPAMERNPSSHYLATLLGQAQLLGNQDEAARSTYSRVLGLLAELGERNVWVAASGLTAALVTGDVERQRSYLDELEKHGPTAEEARSIRRGLERIESKMKTDPVIFDRLSVVLGVRQRAFA